MQSVEGAVHLSYEVGGPYRPALVRRDLVDPRLRHFVHGAEERDDLIHVLEELGYVGVVEEDVVDDLDRLLVGDGPSRVGVSPHPDGIVVVRLVDGQVGGAPIQGLRGVLAELLQDPVR